MLNQDQIRAQHAYRCVSSTTNLKEYKILVNGLGPNIVRSGLVAAVAFIQRNRSDLREQFAKDIAESLPQEWTVPTDLQGLARHVRTVDNEKYMLITREILRLTLWFKRAVQAYDTDSTAEGEVRNA